VANGNGHAHEYVGMAPNAVNKFGSAAR
jgi:hypothetical protein